jgi:hypothetical protein
MPPSSYLFVQQLTLPLIAISTECKIWVWELPWLMPSSNLKEKKIRKSEEVLSDFRKHKLGIMLCQSPVFYSVTGTSTEGAAWGWHGPNRTEN